jgi:hypothetical protein
MLFRAFLLLSLCRAAYSKWSVVITSNNTAMVVEDSLGKFETKPQSFMFGGNMYRFDDAGIVVSQQQSRPISAVPATPTVVSVTPVTATAVTRKEGWVASKELVPPQNTVSSYSVSTSAEPTFSILSNRDQPTTSMGISSAASTVSVTARPTSAQDSSSSRLDSSIRLMAAGVAAHYVL